MTERELRRRFPHASAEFLKANAALESQAAGPAAIVEPDSRDAPLATRQIQEATARRFLVRITSIRKRLLDSDNPCEKFLVDLCRYAGVICDDNYQQTKVEVVQRKCAKGETEKTVIQVWSID